MLGPLLWVFGGLLPNGMFLAHSVVEKSWVLDCSGGGNAARALSSGEEILLGGSGGGDCEVWICDSSDGEGFLGQHLISTKH